MRQILSNFVFKKYVQLFAKSDGVTLLRPPSKRPPTNTNDSAVYSSGSSFSSRLHRFANTAWCERWRYLNILNYNWSPNLQHGRALIDFRGMASESWFICYLWLPRCSIYNGSLLLLHHLHVDDHFSRQKCCNKNHWRLRVTREMPCNILSVLSTLNIKWTKCRACTTQKTWKQPDCCRATR